MDETQSNLMMPPREQDQQAPQGGLAMRALGGLSNFMTNVNKGIETVLTNPLYARAWSGMVSYSAGDPMAGPVALQQLQQMQTQNQIQQHQLKAAQTPTARDELDLMKLHNYKRTQRNMRALEAALADNDPTNDRAAFMAAYPDKAAAAMFSAQAPRNPIQAMVNGQPRWVMPEEAVGLPPVPRGPLVEVRNGEMKPREIIDAEDRAAARVDSKAQPLEVALDAYRAFRALADKIAARGTEPTPAETDSLAKLAARLENPEAVQEGDIARKAGGSLANFFAGKTGLPYTLNLDQLSGLVSTADTIAAAKQQRLNEIYSGAQGVAANRGFDPGSVVPSANIPIGPQAQPPAGFRPHPTVPGLYINDAGEGWVP